jgi:hypothetical protein
MERSRAAARPVGTSAVSTSPEQQVAQLAVAVLLDDEVHVVLQQERLDLAANGKPRMRM